MPRRVPRLLGTVLLLLLTLGVAAIIASRDHDTAAAKHHVQGIVIDESRTAVVNARVRIVGGRTVTRTDERGAFAFPHTKRGQFALAAWKEGYLIGGTSSSDGTTLVRLERLPEVDDPEYEWIDPRPDAAHEQNCGNCHPQIFDEWNKSGHASSARNQRFVSLYEGTDWHGRDNVGWSLRDEHPLGVGVCAACHAPSINFESGASDDMRAATGVAAHGVHCDFCHKIQGLVVNDFGLTHGRFGFSLLRPSDGQLFFGPLDDVARGEDAYLPLQHESAYCASCHEGVVFGTHVYSTYSEWLDSPARTEGKSCQSCHMAPTGMMTNIAPEAGGIERDPATLASHTLLPGGRNAMLRKSLEVAVQGDAAGEFVACRVTLTARNIGHRLPTGFIDRHLILVVQAFDTDDRELTLQAGPLLPKEAGRKLKGVPGRLFAKLLADADGNSPVPFWRGSEAADTRLVPEQPVSTTFAFAGNLNSLRVQVLYRRFWNSVAEQKQWPDDTITVYDQFIRGPQLNTND